MASLISDANKETIHRLTNMIARNLNLNQASVGGESRVDMDKHGHSHANVHVDQKQVVCSNTAHNKGGLPQFLLDSTLCTPAQAMSQPDVVLSSSRGGNHHLLEGRFFKGLTPTTSTPFKGIVSPLANSESSGYSTDALYNSLENSPLEELKEPVSSVQPVLETGSSDLLAQSQTADVLVAQQQLQHSAFLASLYGALLNNNLLLGGQNTNNAVANGLCGTFLNPSIPQQLQNCPSDFTVVTPDIAAKKYRNAAAASEVSCTWSGQLPPHNVRKPSYANKVFVGGVPWDITEQRLVTVFSVFGGVKVDWPSKDGKHSRYPPSGYVYLIFDHEDAIKTLLESCMTDFSSGNGFGEYYYTISSRQTHGKEVQIIPWITSDSNFVRVPTDQLDLKLTVFVGALHGMLTAEAISQIMDDLFGGVVFVGIDTDKHKYPIGSGRVTFSNSKSYLKAIAAAFIEIKTPKFIKKIQIDPYIEESMCNTCHINPGLYFCREQTCFMYFCQACWLWRHAGDTLQQHPPLMRYRKDSKAESELTAYPVENNERLKFPSLSHDLVRDYGALARFMPLLYYPAIHQ